MEPQAVYVCLSYLFGHVYSGSQPNRLEPVLEPQAVYVCLSYLFGHVYSGSHPYRLEPVLEPQAVYREHDWRA